MPMKPLLFSFDDLPLTNDPTRLIEARLALKGHARLFAVTGGQLVGQSGGWVGPHPSAGKRGRERFNVGNRK